MSVEPNSFIGFLFYFNLDNDPSTLHSFEIYLFSLSSNIMILSLTYTLVRKGAVIYIEALATHLVKVQYLYSLLSFY